MVLINENHFLYNGYMWIDVIKNYKPINEQESTDKELILDAYKQYGDKLLTREVPYYHLTSSSMILNKDHTKVLMVYHNIYNSWSWTGGHNDGDPNFKEVAIREAKEETGVSNLELLKEDVASIELIQVVRHKKKGKYVAPHIHMNVSYLLETSETEKLQVKEDENKGVMWIPIKELDSYISKNDEDMLYVYHKLLKDYE